jgi:hypothetical protein
MLQEGTGPSPRLAWLVERHVRPLFRVLFAEIEAAQAQGVVPAGRPEHLCYAMIAAASMPYAVAPEFELVTGEPPATERRVEEHVETLLRLFFS